MRISEEMKEKIYNIAKNYDTDNQVDVLIEEMADVQIMLLQIYFLGDFEDDVIDVMNYKLDRQLERIEYKNEELLEE